MMIFRTPFDKNMVPFQISDNNNCNDRGIMAKTSQIDEKSDVSIMTGNNEQLSILNDQKCAEIQARQKMYDNILVYASTATNVFPGIHPSPEYTATSMDKTDIMAFSSLLFPSSKLNNNNSSNQRQYGQSVCVSIEKNLKYPPENDCSILSKHIISALLYPLPLKRMTASYTLQLLRQSGMENAD